MAGWSLSPASRLFLWLVSIALSIFLVFVLAVQQKRTGLDIPIGARAGIDGGYVGRIDGTPASILGLYGVGTDVAAMSTADDFRAFARQRPDRAIAFEDEDFIEEPDMLPSYTASNRFFNRQGLMTALLSEGGFGVVYARPGEADTVSKTILTVEPRTPADLDPDFWLQIGAAFCILLVAAFLVTLRSGNGPAAAFSVSGLGAAGAALAAAVYSTRDLALPPDLFHILSLLNQSSTFLFGIGAIYLFAVYPVRLLGWKYLWPVPLFCYLHMAAYRLELLPHALATPHNSVVILLAGIVVLVAWQYCATRANPADRAVMLWLGVSVLLGAGSFVLFVTVPVVLGIEVVISQSAAFVPLAAIYAATAIGIMRYRLFDLGRWAYRLMFYVAVIVAVLTADLAIAYLLSLSPTHSLGLAVLAAGILYIAGRDLALRRVLQERPPELAKLYHQTNAVAFQATAAAKQESWIAVIEDHFEPSHREMIASTEGSAPRLLDEGLGLEIPPYAWSTGLRLRLAGGGGRLFDNRDLALVMQLASLVESAERDRLSYEQGVIEERRRIAMDLHDDVGAHLLSGLHARNETHRQEAIIDALSDIRQIASGLSGRQVVLSEFIGHLRHETRNRVEQHGFTLTWPLGNADDSERILPYHTHRNFNAVHREALSNALKHGSPGEIRISTQERLGELVHEIVNPAGRPDEADPHRAGTRLGSGNIRQRMIQLDGDLAVRWADGFYTLRVTLPLEPQKVGS